MKRNALKLLMVLMIGGTLFIGGCAGSDVNPADTVKHVVDKSGEAAKDVIKKYKDGEYDEQIDGVKSKLQDAAGYIKVPSKSDDDEGLSGK